MPVIRQALSGLPAQNGPTAFMPLRAITPSGMDIKHAQHVTLTGQPGTQGIPAPYPDGPTKPVGNAKGSYFPSGLSASQYMPPRWYPQLYYAFQRVYGGIGGVTVYSDNILPTPAVDPRGIPSGAIGPAAFAAYRGLTPTHPARPNRWVRGLGTSQITWPKREPWWPDWKQRG